MALTVVFQGDSITDMNRSRVKEPNKGLGQGYVARIASTLLYEHPDYLIYNRGVSGNRIGDMYARWIEDTLNLHPDVLTVLNGINDIGFQLRLGMGADEDKFEKVYDMCLSEAKAANPNLKLVIFEPFIMKVDAVWEQFGDDIYKNFDEWYANVRKRADICRRLAEKYNALFIPLQERMNKAAGLAPASHWSQDCIHPTHAGNEIIARAFFDATKDWF